MYIRRLTASFCIVALLAETAPADVVATTKGEQRNGVVADREQFAKNPRGASVVSLLVTDEASGQTQILRIAAADIEYVVLEDSDQRRVFDLRTPLPSPSPGPASTSRNPNRLGPGQPGDDANKEGGIALMVVGAGAVLVGALVKFGGAKATITESSIDVDDKSYDAANYILIATGGAMLIGGAIMLGSYDARQHRPGTAVINPGVSVALSFAF